jgi:NTE family protein
MAEGYRAGVEALDHLDACLKAPGGIYPRRAVRLTVDRDRCIGCRMCAAMAPHVMGMDAEGKAFALEELVDWSPADGAFVRHCPTYAIEARRVVPAGEPVPESVVAAANGRSADGPVDRPSTAKVS